MLAQELQIPEFLLVFQLTREEGTNKMWQAVGREGGREGREKRHKASGFCNPRDSAADRIYRPQNESTILGMSTQSYCIQ